MDNLTVREYQGDGTYIDREMNDAEKAQYEKDQIAAANRKAIIAAQLESEAQAKAQLLAQLGITEEQAKLLLS